MQRNDSSFSAWTWAVAAWLIVWIIWLLQNGHNFSGECCPNAGADDSASVATQSTMGEPFSFVASGDEFNSSGDASTVSWLPNAESLRAILSGGEDLRAEGDDKQVILSGIVDSEAIKQQKGQEAQAFFGAGVTVDNRLVIKAADLAQTAAAIEPPPAAKLYFDTGKTTLPADAATTLTPIVDWLKAHSDNKAVLSGYHDPRGDQAFNEELAKNRAKAVRQALMDQGIDEAHIEMRKPQVVEGGADLAEARRVEVSVEQM